MSVADNVVTLLVRVLNQQNQPLGGTVDVDIQSQNTSDAFTVKGVDAARDINVSGIPGFPQVSVYEVTVTPTSVFRPSSQFVNPPASGISAPVVFVFNVGTQAPAPGPTVSRISPNTGAASGGVSNAVNESELAAEISSRLAGNSADGSQLLNVSPTTIIWVERGDEVVVHLDSVQVRLLVGSLLVSVDLETDQTGRATLVAAFALGGGADPAGLTAVTDDLPKGLGTLSARWGKTLQAAIWASLLGYAQDAAAQQSGAPIGLAVSQGSLTVVVGTPLSAQARRA